MIQKRIDHYAEAFLREAERLPSGSREPLLKGRRAIVTGGGKGIGKGITLRLAAAGADVLICGCGNMEMAEETAQEARSLGVRAKAFCADLAREDAADRIVQEAARFLGGVDILVSNAAYQPNLDLQDYTPERFEKVLQINLWSPVRLVSACVPYLRQSGHGRIILISSIHGKRPSGFDIAYATSKGGIQMLMREAALELRRDEITVNAILPGGTHVEFKSGETFQMPHKRVKREREYERAFGTGSPSDSGNLAVFLASDMASYITGTSIRVDGGIVLF